MKFVFFGYDFSFNLFEHLIAAGHEPLGVFTFPCDNQFSFNQDIIARVNAMNIPASLEPPTLEQIARFIDVGADVFIAAGYLYKIPPIDDTKAYAINVHPSYLPKGRGVMPTPYILTGQGDAAGVSVHKITSTFDAGDILMQKRLPLSPLETVETYSARAAMAAPDMVVEVLNGIETYWANARVQDETKATHFPKPPPHMRLLDWRSGVDDIAQTARAFGGFGCVCVIDDVQYAVYALDVWHEDHSHAAGVVIRKTSRDMVVAAADGFVCLKRYDVVE